MYTKSVRRVVLAAGSLVAAGGTAVALLAAAPAQAATVAPAPARSVAVAPAAMSPQATTPTGTVIARIGLNIHAGPYTGTKVIGALKYKQVVKLKYKVVSQSVDGNDIWYKLAGRDGWVTARYVVNHGSVPYAPNVARSAR